MRPLPSEVIAGVRRILQETIEPELTSGHAKARLGEVRAVLAQVDWDDAGFTLAARNRALTDAIGEIAAWWAADPARGTSVPDLGLELAGGTLAGETPAGETPAGETLAGETLAGEETLGAHQAAYRRLAGAAVALVDPLESWLAEHPDDERARDLWHGLLSTL